MITDSLFNGGAIWSATHFSNLGDSSLGPLALDGFNLCSCFATPSGWMMRSGIDGNGESGTVSDVVGENGD